MALLRSCCCWNNVRNGSIASGIYTLILALVNVCLTAYNLQYLLSVEVGQTADNSPGIRATLRWFIAALIVNILLILTSIALLIGINRDNKFLLVPWIVSMIVAIAVDTAALIYECVVLGMLTFNIIQMVIWLGLTMLNIYCILCVLSQYQELSACRGTLEYIHSQRASILYRNEIQQVHIVQGPIFLTAPGSNLLATSTNIQSQSGGHGPQSSMMMQQSFLTTTLVMAPPDYSIATSQLPSYTTTMSASAQGATGMSDGDGNYYKPKDPLLACEETSGSPPPPYTP